VAGYSSADVMVRRARPAASAETADETDQWRRAKEI